MKNTPKESNKFLQLKLHILQDLNHNQGKRINPELVDNIMECMRRAYWEGVVEGMECVKAEWEDTLKNEGY